MNVAEYVNAASSRRQMLPFEHWPEQWTDLLTEEEQTALLPLLVGLFS